MPQRTRRISRSRLPSNSSFLAQRDSAIGRLDLKPTRDAITVEYRGGSRADVLAEDDGFPSPSPARTKARLGHEDDARRAFAF